MVNKCSAFGCKSGYASDNTPKEITFHSFPLQNKDQLDAWIRANPRKDFTPSKHSKLCSRHFKEEDFNWISLSISRYLMTSLSFIMLPDLSAAVWSIIIGVILAGLY